MLAAEHRLRDAADFRSATRGARRSGGPVLVVHARADPSGADPLHEARPVGPVRAGFVVSKAVGGAVVRNRVKRRLRHLVGERLALVPPGTSLVVRALPAAAGATYAELGGELDRGLRRVGALPVPGVR